MILPSQRFSGNYRSVLESALSAVRPEILINATIRLDSDTLITGSEKTDLSRFTNIHVIGIGKGAPALCEGIIGILGDRISSGIVISGEKYEPGSDRITALRGDHPVPGPASMRSGRALIRFIKKIDKEDLLITLITGGASAMAVSPPEGIGLDELSDVNRHLIRSGASISEINCVRKHLSTIKGGLLARLVYPVKILSLILSDVTGSDPGVIGSGLFYGDRSTFRDALDVIMKYPMNNPSETKILEHLHRGCLGDINETPEPEDKVFGNIFTYILGDNRTALTAAMVKGEQLGFSTEILTSEEKGDVRDAALRYGELVRKKALGQKSVTRDILLLAGGEFTVNVSGSGEGGRVQEFLLRLLTELKDLPSPFFIAGIGTDGRDGMTDAAGAWISDETIGRAENEGIDILLFLNNNDSHNFFRRIDQLIFTGPTGTNVADVFFFFIRQPVIPR